MAADTRDVVGHTDSTFRLEIREAVQMAMQVFAQSLSIVADLKVCLIRNRTATPFVTSDDPAILTTRWQLLSTKAKGHSFGLHSAGDILLLPLSPMVLCIAYDGDVYSIPHRNGWTEVRQYRDVEAFNHHQYLNCRANVFFQSVAHGPLVHQQFERAMPNRPEKRHVIHYAVLDRTDGDWTRYRVVERYQAAQDEEALIHNQVVHATGSFGLARYLGGRRVASSRTALGWVTCGEPGPKATAAGRSGVSLQLCTDYYPIIRR